jgi:hypothetical protein
MPGPKLAIGFAKHTSLRWGFLLLEIVGTISPSQTPPHFGGGFSAFQIVTDLLTDSLANTSPLRWG